jgi:hypothetical protein
MFRGAGRDETFAGATKPFCDMRAELRKRCVVIRPLTIRRKAESGGLSNGRLRKMRPLSMILAAGPLLAGSTTAGTVQGTLPGVATFSYNGTPIAPASQAVIVATR